jgi:hypothetical protein
MVGRAPTGCVSRILSTTFIVVGLIETNIELGTSEGSGQFNNASGP